MSTTNFFISSIYDNDIYIKTPNISYKGLFDYNETKDEIITFNIVDIGTDMNIDDFEIVNNDNIDNDINKMKEKFIKEFKEEQLRVKKVIEYLVVNVDISKLELPYYKAYDYGEVPKYMKSKIKKHINFFDIKTFITRNKINKDYITNLMDIRESVNDSKLCQYYILYKVLELYNQYNKALIYSIELLKNNPNLLKDKNHVEYLVKINPNHFVIKNDEIHILHLNEIKNAYKRNEENKENKTSMVIQSSTTVVLYKQHKINNYKLVFK